MSEKNHRLVDKAIYAALALLIAIAGWIAAHLTLEDENREAIGQVGRLRHRVNRLEGRIGRMNRNMDDIEEHLRAALTRRCDC